MNAIPHVKLTSSGQHRPIRVLVVTARFFPDLGGIETHTYEVTRRLASRDDFQFTVLTTDRSGSLPLREEFDGFTVLRCRSYPRRRDYYLAPGVYKHIVNNEYDLVHCQGIHSAVPVLAMMGAKHRRIPFVVTFHTGGHSSGLRNRVRGIQWRTLAPLINGAAVVVAVSRFEQRVFQKACHLEASRFRIIQNGGDLPANPIGAEVIPGRIVSSGRLERYKGHQRVIEALPFVQRSIPEASLQILGSGPYEAALRSLIRVKGLEDSVTIEHVAPGNRARMAECLGRAAALAALSEYEAHPVAVMEALSLGIPTVGLNVAGIGDLVEDRLVKGVPRDASPAVVADTLIGLLKGPRATRSTELPTWDMAARDLAHIYIEASGPR